MSSRGRGGGGLTYRIRGETSSVDAKRLTVGGGTTSYAGASRHSDETSRRSMQNVLGGGGGGRNVCGAKSHGAYMRAGALG